MHDLSTVNAMSTEDFIATFGELYESSPWVAEAAAASRPFKDLSAFQAALRAAVERSSVTAQDALIRAHPALAGRLAREGQLTQASTKEQARLGLDRLSDAEFLAFDALNQAYETKFHFPFIICLGLLSHKNEVTQAFDQRIGNTLEQERGEALNQIHHIAEVRLRARLAETACDAP
jgi:2-oxo-4-hydroxy-4-carboxy-5-ureidoimidazoline decarboxylase